MTTLFNDIRTRTNFIYLYSDDITIFLFDAISTESFCIYMYVLRLTLLTLAASQVLTPGTPKVVT